MRARNIFTAASRYAYDRRQGENFITEGLAFVLEMLRDNEPKAFQNFMNYLFNQPLQVDTSKIVVTTQEITNQGRPDLAISQSTDFVIFIEVKDYSGLGWEQLTRYHKELEKREEKQKLLFLLTRSKESARQVNLSSEYYTHILWYQVASWLAALPLQKEVTKYIVQSYVSFLEDCHMSLVQIKNYGAGAIEMGRMLDLINNALEVALPNEKFSPTNPWQQSFGYYWQPEKHWMGFYLETPTVIWLEKGGSEKPRLTEPLNLEEINFFNMDSGEQLDTLIRFIRENVEEFKIPSSPSV